MNMKRSIEWIHKRMNLIVLLYAIPLILFFNGFALIALFFSFRSGDSIPFALAIGFFVFVILDISYGVMLKDTIMKLRTE